MQRAQRLCAAIALLLPYLLLLAWNVAIAAASASSDSLDALPVSRSLDAIEIALDVGGYVLPVNNAESGVPETQAEQLYQSALELYRQGEVADAIALAERAAALSDTLPSLFFLAQAYDKRGEFDAALQLHQRALHVASSNADTLPLDQSYWLSFQYAEFLHQRAIPHATADPNAVDALRIEAIEHYQRALAADRALLSSSSSMSTNPSELLNHTLQHTARNRMHTLNTIGTLLNDLQRFQDAVPYFEQAIAVDATAVQPLGNLALALASFGQLDDALQLNERALALAPDQPRLLHNTGLVLQLLDRHDDAVALWLRAHAISPHEIETLSAIAGYYAAVGDMHTCRSYLQQAQAVADAALAREPQLVSAVVASHANRVRLANAQLPVVYQSAAEIDDARAAYEAALRALLQTPKLLLPDPVVTTSVNMAGYYAEYQGFNDAAIRAQLAQIYRRGSPVLTFTAEHVRAGRAKRHRYPSVATYATSPRSTDTATTDDVAVHTGRKIRVGFHSAFLRHHSVGLLTHGVVTHLSRDAFDVTVLVYESNAQDALTARVLAAADNVVLLSSNVATAQQQVAALALDVLVFTEIGMDVSAYLLAFARLALRSVLFWGHAVTSGVDSVDYFVSSKLFGLDNDDDQQRRFTECVYEMAHLTTRFERPAATSDAVAPTNVDTFRTSLGLPSTHQQRTMFLIPQTLYKLHPDMDALLDRILQATPTSFLVVLTGYKPRLADAVRTRWRRTLSADAYRRVYFVRLLATQEFLDLCATADIVLDPFPVGGGRSSFEVFAAGTPIVVHAPRTSILQLTAAMYRIMGLDDDLVALTDDAYVMLAIRLANEPELRAYYRRLITAASHKLYESDDVVHEWETFLVAILAAPSPVERSAERHVEGARTRNECPLIDASASALSTAIAMPSSPVPVPLFEVTITIPRYGGTHEAHTLQLQTLEDDPFEVAHAYFNQRNQSTLDWCHRDIAAKMLWNAKHRQSQPVAGVAAFGSSILADLADDVTDNVQLAPIEVRYGDDLYLVASAHLQRERTRLGVGPTSAYAALITPTAKVLERALPAFSSPQWIAARSFPLQHRFAVMSAPAPSSPHARDCVTLLITTCKRLALFLRMVASLERVLGVSTDSDAEAARGWARWFCHIVVVDDNSSAADRTAMRERMASASVEFVFKRANERGHARSLALGVQRAQSRYLMYVEDDWEFTGGVGAAEATTFLSDALTILRTHRTSLYEPLALVLLNDQQSGWTRHVRTADRSVRYFVHEYATSDPAHTLAYWPGFSFNPGVWDLHAITRALGHDDDSTVAPPPLFAEGIDLFEHDFCIRVWRSGLRIAHLDTTHAVHIGACAGTNASAYVLNGLPRRYDAPDYGR